MKGRPDDEDAACLDCALDSCDLCLEADPRDVGERSCCCGRADEVDQWADEVDDDQDDDQGGDDA